MIEVKLAPSAAPAAALDLGNASLPTSQADREALVRRWLESRTVRLPQLDPALLSQPAFFNVPSRILQSLVLRVQHFVQNVNGNSDKRLSGDFRAQYTHAVEGRLGDAFPGLAWVVVVTRSSYQTRYSEVVREGGGAGLQIPLLSLGGPPSIDLKKDQTQLLLRLLPVAGNYDLKQVGDDPENRIKSPDTGLFIRPSAELELAHRVGDVVPGARFLFQPRIDGFSQYRVLTEVFVNFELKTNNQWVPRASIVPRCILDRSTHSPTLAGVTNPVTRNIYLQADQILTCGINTEFTID